MYYKCIRNFAISHLSGGQCISGEACTCPVRTSQSNPWQMYQLWCFDLKLVYFIFLHKLWSDSMKNIPWYTHFGMHLFINMRTIQYRRQIVYQIKQSFKVCLPRWLLPTNFWIEKLKVLHFFLQNSVNSVNTKVW